mmetsp:Transcript_33746/g.96962  ORF Transcript_33746/g.96962 Transcript_33746/m.96962 type:complete len:330 (-) Transcript_33746:1803-2792(-)
MGQEPPPRPSECSSSASVCDNRWTSSAVPTRRSTSLNTPANSPRSVRTSRSMETLASRAAFAISAASPCSCAPCRSAAISAVSLSTASAVASCLWLARPTSPRTATKSSRNIANAGISVSQWSASASAFELRNSATPADTSWMSAERAAHLSAMALSMSVVRWDNAAKVDSVSDLLDTTAFNVPLQSFNMPSMVSVARLTSASVLRKSATTSAKDDANCESLTFVSWRSSSCWCAVASEASATILAVKCSKLCRMFSSLPEGLRGGRAAARLDSTAATRFSNLASPIAICCASSSQVFVNSRFASCTCSMTHSSPSARDDVASTASSTS